MNQNWGYQYPTNQYQPYHNQFGKQHPTPTFNSFTQTNGRQSQGKNQADNTNTIIEQMTKLLNSLKTPAHQVQEVQAQPTSESWDLGQTAKLPQNPTEESEWLARDPTAQVVKSENETEQPLTPNNRGKSHNEQNQNCHQRAPKPVTNSNHHQKAPKTKQTNSDPEGHTNQVKWPSNISPTEPTEPTRHTEILSIHINDMQTSIYNTSIGNSNVKTLFDSGATLSCISQWFYDRIWLMELDQVIDTNAGLPL